MAAVHQLPDPCQRAALIVARWAGARRDEIRRLTVDCLDTYPDGHPRLRIPVGKGHAERSIPLHPDAAEALRPLIEIARRLNARAQFDPSAARAVQYIFVRRGKLLPKGMLFDQSLKVACTAAGLLDSRGRPAVSAHRFRHTVGTQLAEGGARLQTIMAVLGHQTPSLPGQRARGAPRPDRSLPDTRPAGRPGSAWRAGAAFTSQTTGRRTAGMCP